MSNIWWLKTQRNRPGIQNWSALPEQTEQHIPFVTRNKVKGQKNWKTHGNLSWPTLNDWKTQETLPAATDTFSARTSIANSWSSRIWWSLITSRTTQREQHIQFVTRNIVKGQKKLKNSWKSLLTNIGSTQPWSSRPPNIQWDIACKTALPPPPRFGRWASNFSARGFKEKKILMDFSHPTNS